MVVYCNVLQGAVKVPGQVGRVRQNVPGEDARACAHLDYVEGRGCAHRPPQLLQLDRYQSAEGRVSSGRGIEVSSNSVFRRSVIAPVWVIEGLSHEFGEGDPALLPDETANRAQRSISHISSHQYKGTPLVERRPLQV